MYACNRCSNSIDVKTQSICFFKKNSFHQECCKICTPVRIIKEKTPPPPPPPKIELGEAKKARAGVGRLNFNKLGNFEEAKEVNCQDCKKKIESQRFLTHKLGEFRCKNCNEKYIDKCNMCHIPFEGEHLLKECFKDDEGHNCCGKCIKIYQEEKKKKELAKQQAVLDAAAAKAVPPPKPVVLKRTMHCDCCTGPITSEIIDFEGEYWHFDCFSCYSCKSKLKYQTVFRQEKGLVCFKCKKQVKCNFDYKKYKKIA